MAYCLSDERLISSSVNKNSVYCDIFLQNIIQDRDNVGDLLKTDLLELYNQFIAPGLCHGNYYTISLNISQFADKVA